LSSSTARALATTTLRNYQPGEYVISTRVFPFEYADAVQADIDEVNTVLAQMQPDADGAETVGNGSYGRFY
jgi:hypothetical protein